MHIAPDDSSLDRRARRTQTALRDALLSLMAEKTWDAIEVAAICERADVARSTFYLHFANKDELLQSGLQGLQAHLQSGTGVKSKKHAAPWSGFRFTSGLLDHVFENRGIFRAIIGRRSGFVVQQRFREMILRLIRQELPGPAAGLPREATARLLASALAEMMGWWVEQRPAMAPEQLAAAYNGIATAILSKS